MEDSGVMLPVIEASLNYRKPVFYDTLMDVRLLIFDEPSVRLITYYQIYTDDDKPNITGKVTLCFMDEQTRRPVRAPEAFINGIHNYVEKSA